MSRDAQARMDITTLPGHVALDAVYDGTRSRFTRDVVLVFAVTFIVALGAYVLVPRSWWIVGSVIGILTAVVLGIWRPDMSRVIDMLAWGRHALDDLFQRDTGTEMPATREEVVAWLESPSAQEAPAAVRSDALRWIGDLVGARRVLDEAIATDPIQALELACSRFNLDFAVYVDGDWTAWRSAIDRAAALDFERARSHLVEMAIYRAAFVRKQGGDWIAELERAYADYGPFPADDESANPTAAIGAAILIPLACVWAMGLLASLVTANLP